MAKRFITPKELLKAADVTELQRDDYFIVAVTQKGESEDSIKVCQIGVDDWIDVPMKMIASAKIVGSASSEDSRYQVALIKLNEPTDPYAKFAYRLLSQLGIIKKGEKCQDGEKTSARLGGNIGGGLGVFGLGGNCHFEFQWYECECCIPWTDGCWSSTCCDLVKVDCTVEV